MCFNKSRGNSLKQQRNPLKILVSIRCPKSVHLGVKKGEIWYNQVKKKIRAKPLIDLVFGVFLGLAVGSGVPTHNPLVAGSNPAGPTHQKIYPAYVSNVVSPHSTTSLRAVFWRGNLRDCFVALLLAMTIRGLLRTYPTSCRFSVSP